jgi:hypothetical protein
MNASGIMGAGRSAMASALLAIALGASGIAWGAVAGTGTFDIDVNGLPPNITFDGTLSFANEARMVGGTSVNLGTSAGVVPYSGSAAVDVQALDADFDLTATKTGFNFTGEGVAACTSSCLTGTATFVGIGSAVSGGSLPSDFAYTFDGTIGLLAQTGNFALNAYANVDTPAGPDVSVTSGLDSFFDSKTLDLREFLVELVFTAVNTPGFTNFLGATVVPGKLPDGIGLIPDESVFIDIVTTAGFSGPVDVCVAYDDVDADGVVDGTDVLVSQLRLLHALATGGDFADVTTSVGSGKVCGQVTSLSPFVVAAGPAPTTTSTTTTTVTTTSTVTTTLPEKLAGKKLLLKDKAGKPQKRALQCLATGITLGDGNQSDDDPVVHGGTLFYRAANSTVSYELPASGWKYQGKAGQNKGYKFKGTRAIKSVIVKKGKLVSIVGKGDGLGQDLSTDPRPVRITLQLGARRYCTEFGGTIQFKAGTKYLAKGAPAPTACSPSGAFVE